MGYLLYAVFMCTYCNSEPKFLVILKISKIVDFSLLVNVKDVYYIVCYDLRYGASAGFSIVVQNTVELNVSSSGLRWCLIVCADFNFDYCEYGVGCLNVCCRI